MEKPGGGRPRQRLPKGFKSDQNFHNSHSHTSVEMGLRPAREGHKLLRGNMTPFNPKKPFK